MRQTLEELVRGNQQIVEHYRTAQRLWDDLVNGLSWDDISELAARLGAAQMDFEHECGGRWLGQEVMVVSGFARLYSVRDGFSDTNRERARSLAQAFEQSGCSVEVKGSAEKVARLYDVDED